MSRAGFTLLEMLVTLTVIGVLLTLAVPSFQRLLPGVEIKAAARDVAATLKEARGTAIRTGREAAVAFDAAGGGYGLDGARPARLPQGVRLAIRTAAAERLGDRAAAIRFYPDGTATGGAVTLANGAGSLVVSVDWLTGQATIGEP